MTNNRIDETVQKGNVFGLKLSDEAREDAEKKVRDQCLKKMTAEQEILNARMRRAFCDMEFNEIGAYDKIGAFRRAQWSGFALSILDALNRAGLKVVDK